MLILGAESLHAATGRLSYSDSPAYKLVVAVDPEVSRYYRRLLPGAMTASAQKYPPHISVVRKETPPCLDAWGKYEGAEVEFAYGHVLRWGEVYVWLNCFSTRLEEIRLELGLSIAEDYTVPPSPYRKTWHCTIGNFK